MTFPFPFVPPSGGPATATLTAATGSSSRIGFSSQSAIGTFGSLSGQPAAGITIRALFSNASGQMLLYVDGEEPPLTGKSVMINGVAYPISAGSLGYASGFDNTFITWATGVGFVFSSGVAYEITIV